MPESMRKRMTRAIRDGEPGVGAPNEMVDAILDVLENPSDAVIDAVVDELLNAVATEYMSPKRMAVVSLKWSVAAIREGK